MRYQLVSFDLDRTLIFHAKESKQEEVVGMLHRQGVAVTVDRYRKAAHLAREFYDVLGYSYAADAVELRYEYVRLVVESLGCAEPAVIRAVADYYQAYDEEPSNFFVPLDARELLSSLLARGVRLVAVSSNLSAAQRVRHCGIAGMFEEVYSPVMGAPKAALFPLLLQESGCDPAAVVHTGDDPILDVLAPKRAGLAAILYDPDHKYSHLAWPSVAHTYAGLEPYLTGR